MLKCQIIACHLKLDAEKNLFSVDRVPVIVIFSTKHEKAT